MNILHEIVASNKGQLMVGDFLRDVYYIQDSMWDDIDWIIQIHYLKAGVYELPKMFHILQDLSSLRHY